MKIASIFAAMPGNYAGLLEVKKIVSETLTELGIAPEEINLGYRSLPYYDGIKSDYMNTLSEVIGSSDGVIMYVGASFGLPGALIQTLVEHFNFASYQGLMTDKNCFIIMNCDDGSGNTAMSAMEMAINNMGAFCQTKLLIDRHFTEELKEGDKRYTMVERLCEDYYRSLRQQRVVYRPKSAGGAPISSSGMGPRAPKESAVPAESVNYEPLHVKQVIEGLNKDAFTEAQRKDIDEISRFFSNKFKESEAGESIAENVFIENPVVPDIGKTEKPSLALRTGSLTHYYKAGQSDGLNASIALNITGGDGFMGYLSISGADCDFNMGSIENPDVTIIAEDSKWADIIRGKISAQKAFMIGQIKVRGNFVLLSRFDQLFDFERNVF